MWKMLFAMDDVSGVLLVFSQGKHPFVSYAYMPTLRSGVHAGPVWITLYQTTDPSPRRPKWDAWEPCLGSELPGRQHPNRLV
jgi:hypothetical protein